MAWSCKNAPLLEKEIPATSAAGNLRQLAVSTFVAEVNGSLALRNVRGRMERRQNEALNKREPPGQPQTGENTF